jgi:DNA-binding transcriptional LysR family regulator
MTLLVAVAEAGSISAASRKLRVPIATISRNVSELEGRLNARLLMRSARHIVLTEAGRTFVAASRRILADLDDAERNVASESTALKGALILSAPIALGRFYLLPVVAAFLNAHPEIDVRLMLSDRRLNMIDDRIDVGLRVGELNDLSLVARKVGAVRRVACASPSYLERRGAPKSPEDLKDHDCITFENTLSAQNWIFRVGKAERAFPIRSRLIVSTAEAAADADAAVAGLGVTRMLDYQIDLQRRAGSLELVLDTFRSPPKAVHLIYESGRHLPLKIRTFIDFAAPRLKTAMRSLAH